MLRRLRETGRALGTRIHDAETGQSDVILSSMNHPTPPLIDRRLQQTCGFGDCNVHFRSKLEKLASFYRIMEMFK